jgi:hypothetical protein
MISDKHLTIIRELLAIEHKAIASKLNFIPKEELNISENLLYRSVGLLDQLSRDNNDETRKLVITVSAILWTYKDSNWDGLREYLVLVLNRIGFSPTALMVDGKKNHGDQKLDGLNSLINQFSITLHQLKHEILIDSEKILLTSFQKEVWSKLNKVKLLGISAPTSAGKSFIILLKSIEMLLSKKGIVVYIVPTLSLVSQVVADYHKELKKYKLDDYEIVTTYNPNSESDKRIYVLTQERALSALGHVANPFKNIRMLIVDEIQNIERVANSDDQRAKTLYDALIEFRYNCSIDLTIISGPRVNGLKELGIEIFDIQDIGEVETKSSPVASITYSISRSNKYYYFNQYTDILNKHSKIRIINDKSISGYDNVTYSIEFINYLYYIISNLGDKNVNIIFSPTAAQARKTAVKLSKIMPNSTHNILRSSLKEYLQETVHSNYEMANIIEKGIVYHHGKIPTHARFVIERAIREKLINNIVCTTTLLQGVNLPAQNIILRNPDLAIKKQAGIKPKLTNYEFANLRGRAGRLLKDFIGRTFVLQENTFESDDKQTELFAETEKTLKSGYKKKFQKYKEEISQDLIKNHQPSENTNEYAFLTTYIRQTVLKHGIESSKILSSVGIDLGEKELINTIEELQKLQVPKNVCFSNRYWDPLHLDLLFKNKEKFNLPTSQFSDKIVPQLNRTLTLLNELSPMSYKKYFGISHPELLWSICLTTKDWITEQPLRKILDKPYFDNSENIEKSISRLYNKIAYGLPMLLKPIYDILTPESMFLRFIEIGAYSPITRKLIEFNIPRETAIYLKKNYFSDISELKNVSYDEEMINILKRIYDRLPFWYQIQLENLI